MELTEQLEEDLQFLANQLHAEGPLPLANIRLAASGICRKWLIEKHLVKLFHRLELQLTLPALDTSPHIDFINRDGGFDFYTSGGVSIDGRPINSIYAHKDPRPQKVTQSILAVPEIKLFTASKFLSRKCTYVQQTWITSEDILRFVANKSGGIHFDKRRDKHIEKRIERASQALWLGDTPPEPWPNKLEIYLQLPKLTNAHWNCTHIEMLSIAQSLLALHVNGHPLIESYTNPKSSNITFFEPFVGAFKKILNR